MPKLTAQEAAEKWSQRLRGAVSDIQKGVDRVSTPPGQAAAAKKTKWVAKLSDPTIQDKWARNVAAVDLVTWKNQTKEKVASRLSGGVTAATPKMQSRYSDMFPFMDSLETRVKAMPDTTLQDAIARSVAWQEGMATYKAR